jgi:predicted 2-oxoglutarate/Fe(II)-dependent dioxygenase YbiX
MNIYFTETINNCPIAVVDNFYDVKELEKINTELHLLYALGKLNIFNNICAAKNQENEVYQKSTSFFLDVVYNNKRDASNILTINKKLFLNEELKESLINKNLFFKHIFTENRYSTLLNFYKTGDYYKTHRDSCFFTAITFFKLENFSGGNLVFPEYDVSIEAVENRMVIFPGFMLHTAEEVKSGIRVSMSQFINYNSMLN